MKDIIKILLEETNGKKFDVEIVDSHKNILCTMSASNILESKLKKNDICIKNAYDSMEVNRIFSVECNENKIIIETLNGIDITLTESIF